MPATSRAAVRRLAAARLVSLAGTDASAVALAFTLYAQTRSTAWLSAALLIQFGLGALLGPLGGALADRCDRRALMIGAELVGGACLAVLAVWHPPVALLGVSLVATAAGCVFGPAAGAAIPAVAGAEHLSWANGLLATGGNIGKTAGRLGAGVLLAALGTGAVFAIDAVTFALSAALIATVPGPFADRAAHAAPVAAVAEADAAPARGVRALGELLRADARLRLVIASACAASLVTSFSMLAENPLVVLLDGGPAALGALTACWSAGMIAGSAAAARLLDDRREALGLFAGRVVMGLGLGAVAFMPHLAPVLVCYLVGGAAGGFLLVAAQGILQRAAGDGVRGRVLAVAESLRTGAWGAGMVAAGVLGDVIGPRPSYLLAGLGVLVGALPAWRLAAAQHPAGLARTVVRRARLRTA